MDEKKTPQVGDTVTVLVKGRRKRIYIEQIEDCGDGALFLIGRIPSVKFPGDFIGKANAWANQIVT